MRGLVDILAIVVLSIVIVAVFGIFVSTFTIRTIPHKGNILTISINTKRLIKWVHGSEKSLIRYLVKIFKNYTTNILVNTCSTVLDTYADLPTCGINYTAFREVKYVGHYVYFNVTCNGTLLDTLLTILSLNSTMITPTAYLATLYMFSPIVNGRVTKCRWINYTSMLWLFTNSSKIPAVSWRAPIDVEYRLLSLSEVPYPPSLIISNVSYRFVRTLEKYVSKTVSTGETCCSYCCASYSKTITTIVRLRLFKICFRYDVINGSKDLSVTAIAKIDGKKIVKKSSRRRGTLCISVPLLDNESHSISLVAYVNDSVRIGNFTIRRIPYVGLRLRLFLKPTKECTYTYGTVSCTSGNNTCTFTVVTSVTCHYDVKVRERINITRLPKWIFEKPSKIPDIVNGTLLLASLVDLYRSKLYNASLRLAFPYVFDIATLITDDLANMNKSKCIGVLSLKLLGNDCLSDASLLMYATASILYPTTGVKIGRGNRTRLLTILKVHERCVEPLLEAGYNTTITNDNAIIVIDIAPSLVNATCPIVEPYRYGLSNGTLREYVFKRRMLFTSYLTFPPEIKVGNR